MSQRRYPQSSAVSHRNAELLNQQRDITTHEALHDHDKHCQEIEIALQSEYEAVCKYLTCSQKLLGSRTTSNYKINE